MHREHLVQRALALVPEAVRRAWSLTPADEAQIDAHAQKAREILAKRVLPDAVR